MKYKYVVNKHSHVVVKEVLTASGNIKYECQHFKNNCSRGMLKNTFNSLQQAEKWIDELKEFYNG